MITEWQSIAEALRREIAEYGGLLHLFEEQQRTLFARDAEGVLRISDEIVSRLPVVEDARRAREECVGAFAAQLGKPTSSTLRSLIGLFAPEAQPLIEALVTEINLLIHRVRRTSRHNQALLRRAVESHQQVVRLIRPDSHVQTYAPSGRVSELAMPASAALHAVG